VDPAQRTRTDRVRDGPTGRGTTLHHPPRPRANRQDFMPRPQRSTASSGVDISTKPLPGVVDARRRQSPGKLRRGRAALQSPQAADGQVPARTTSQGTPVVRPARVRRTYPRPSSTRSARRSRVGSRRVFPTPTEITTISLELSGDRGDRRARTGSIEAASPGSPRHRAPDRRRINQS